MVSFLGPLCKIVLESWSSPLPIPVVCNRLPPRLAYPQDFFPAHNVYSELKVGQVDNRFSSYYRAAITPTPLVCSTQILSSYERKSLRKHPSCSCIHSRHKRVKYFGPSRLVYVYRNTVYPYTYIYSHTHTPTLQSHQLGIFDQR